VDSYADANISGDILSPSSGLNMQTIYEISGSHGGEYEV
jgi:hypothetical protein